MKQVFGVLILAMLLAGCASSKNFSLKRKAATFDGQSFRISAKSIDRKNRKDFTVRVRPVSNSPKGAALAAQYEATRYCIKYFGTSDLAWPIDPSQEGVSLPVEDDNLILEARCVE